MSAVCEAFGCTPAEAEEQDWTLVQAVLDYRAAERAVEIFNGPDKGRAFQVLSQARYLLRVLAQMHRAQAGRPLDSGDARRDAAEGMAVAQENRTGDTGADGEEEGGGAIT